MDDESKDAHDSYVLKDEAVQESAAEDHNEILDSGASGNPPEDVDNSKLHPNKNCGDTD